MLLFLLAGNVYWKSIPPSNGFYYFMLVISVLAAIIASQAVISGAYSIVRQVKGVNGMNGVKIVEGGKLTVARIIRA